MIENDPVDIAAIEATFNAGLRCLNGTNNSTEKAYLPGNGRDLIWSPTTARADYDQHHQQRNLHAAD